jgi:3-isopropylmalate dehydratase small subunit
MKTLQELVERNPRTELRIDLTAGTCEAGDLRCKVSLPPNVRDAFATGAWDTTGLLLDRYDEVTAASGRLPYVDGFVTGSGVI